MLIGTSKHTATLINENLLMIFGGFKAKRVIRYVDLTTYKWDTVKDIEFSRIEHTANASETSILLFGGRNRLTQYNELLCFDN